MELQIHSPILPYGMHNAGSYAQTVSEEFAPKLREQDISTISLIFLIFIPYLQFVSLKRD
jgi:hypothetical protein